MKVKQRETRPRFLEVIHHHGDTNTFAWRYPNHHIRRWSQVIVNEAQEAVFVKDGLDFQVLKPGRHSLKSGNIPFLDRFLSLFFNGESPFLAEIWFVNKANVLDVKWGTTNPLQLRDPKYDVCLPVRAFGQFGLQINDSIKFMQKLVGNMDVFNRNSILDFFKGVYLTKIGDIISSYLIHSGISLLEVNAYLDEISAFALEEMSEIFDTYGVKLVSFYVNNVNVPENDPVLVELKAALAKKTTMELVGYSYQQERSFDTMEGAANNPNSMSSGFMGAGLGLGMGAGLGGMMGTQFGDIAKVLNVEELKTCPACNGKIGKFEKFCHLCGADTTVSANAPIVAESDESDE